MTAGLLLVGCVLLLAATYPVLGLLHPATVCVSLWVLIALGFALRPFNLVQPSTTVTIAILAGLAALCVPSVLATRSGRRPSYRARPGAPPAPPLVPRTWLLGLAAVGLLGAVSYGVLSFRSAISAALGGQSFGELDAKLIRYAELYGNAQLSAAGSLAFSLVPLLGCVAVVGGLCHHWGWFVLLPVSLALTLQSPSRTTTITLLVTSIFFYLLLSRTPVSRLVQHGVRLTRAQAIGLAGVTVALGVSYFAYVGQALDKAGVEPGIEAASWLPDALAQPLIYQMGGVSAFTVALEHPPGAGGPYGEFGRSVYALTKVAGLLGVDMPPPLPFAAYVDIPSPFNTYTAFGDTYFDMGMAGVIGLFLVTGLVIAVFSRWPWRGHPGSMWVLATMTAVVTATPLHMRLLDGDILVQALGGWLLLWAVLGPAANRVGGRRGPDVDGARPPIETVSTTPGRDVPA